MKRVIISDLHIGSKYADEKKLLQFLNNLDCVELILAGDIIDFIKIPTFTEQSYALFKIIENFEGKVIYIVGNHDISFQKLAGKEAFGILFLNQYEFIDGKRKYRVEHGHKYEKGIVTRRFVMNIISIFQDAIERIMNFNLGEWYHQMVKNRNRLRRIWDIVEWNNDADVFIMGHTHTPEVLIWVDHNEKIKTYVNTGDWVEHQTYVVIENDVVRLKNWKLEKENQGLKKVKESS